jgi:hypothetical protein
MPPELDIEGVLRPGRSLTGVDQQQLQPALLQHLPDRLPVLPRCLHHHLGDALGCSQSASASRLEVNVG